MKRIIVLLCIACTFLCTQTAQSKVKRKARSKYLLEIPVQQEPKSSLSTEEIKETIIAPIEKKQTESEKEESEQFIETDTYFQQESMPIPEPVAKSPKKEKRQDLVDRFLNWSRKSKKEKENLQQKQYTPQAIPFYQPTAQANPKPKPKEKEARLDFIDRFLKGKKEKKKETKSPRKYQQLPTQYSTFAMPQQIQPGPSPFGIHNIASQLYRVEQDVAMQLKQEISENIRRIALETKEEMQRIALQKQEEQKMLIRDIQESTKKKITQAEIRLLEEQINSMKKSLGQKPVRKDNLSTWKTKSKDELQENILYLGEVLKSDPELHNMLQSKMNSLELTISVTQNIGDTSYKTATKELMSLTKLYQSQKLADLLLEKALESIDVNSKMRKEIRLIVLYELQPLVEKALKTDDEISTSGIQDIVLLAIKEVKQKQKPDMKIDIPKVEIKISETEKVTIEKPKEMISKLELLEKEVEQQKQALKEEEKESEKLRNSLSELAKEKVELEILVEKTRQELKRAKFNNARLKSFKDNLEQMKKKLEQQQEKYIEVKILLERSKQNLELVRLDKKEKIKKNKLLEEQINKSKEDLEKAQAKIDKINELQNRLTNIQTSVQTLKQEKTSAQQSYIQSRKAYTQARFRSKYLERENEKLKIKQIAILEKYAEIASIRRDIHELDMQLVQETDPDEQKEIREEIDEERAELRETQRELRRLIKVKELHAQARQFAEQARTTQLEASISTQRQKGAIDHLLTTLVQDTQEPMEEMRSERIIESIVEQVRDDLDNEEPPPMDEENFEENVEAIEENDYVPEIESTSS